MAFDIEEIIHKTKNYAADAKKVMPVNKVILFGSWAKGCATEFSDVDICFFLDNYNGKQRVDIIAELLGLGGKYPDIAMEPLVFKSDEMVNGNPFVQVILREGIQLL